jgi:hypothetical protein
VRPQLLVEYINLKSLRPGEDLNIYMATAQIQCRNSDTMLEYLELTVDWNCKVPLYKCLSAIMNLHRLYNNLRQQYCSKCLDCGIQKSNNLIPGTYRSCVNHAGWPHLRELGDPTNSTIYTDAEATAVRHLRSHVTIGSMQLLPGDVSDLCDVLIGTRIVDLQMYVMKILGTNDIICTVPINWNILGTCIFTS